MSVVQSAHPIRIGSSTVVRTGHRLALVAILLLLAAEVFLSNRQESQTWAGEVADGVTFRALRDCFGIAQIRE